MSSGSVIPTVHNAPPAEEPVAFGKHLKRLRERHNKMTQGALSEQSGISVDIIRALENGRVKRQIKAVNRRALLSVFAGGPLRDDGLRGALPLGDYIPDNYADAPLNGTTSADVDWVARNISVRTPSVKRRPSNRAWAMLSWVRRDLVNEGDFWNKIYPRYTATKAQLEAEARQEDPGKITKELLDRTRRSLRKSMAGCLTRCPKCSEVYLFLDRYRVADPEVVKEAGFGEFPAEGSEQDDKPVEDDRKELDVTSEQVWDDGFGCYIMETTEGG